MPSDLVVVLDTSVWISGVFFRRGIPASILRAWRDQRFEIVFSPETLDELERKLQEKASGFGADPALVREWITYIGTFAHVIPSTVTISGVCRDPDDDKFIGLALSSGASYIVSSDHDLQVLDEYRAIKVLSPREFAEWLEIVPPISTSDVV
jgi:putative PIN family toxin of toxin-antitoxin system